MSNNPILITQLNISYTNGFYILKRCKIVGDRLNHGEIQARHKQYHSIPT